MVINKNTISSQEITESSIILAKYLPSLQLHASRF